MDATNLPKKILVIDDDRSVCQGLMNQLQKYSINVQIATDLDTAFYMFSHQSFDVVIIELEFEPLAGLALAQKFRANTTNSRHLTGLIIASGKGRDAQDANLLRELGDLEFIDKPIQVIKLLPYLARCVERKAYLQGLEKVRELVYQAFRHGKSAEESVKRLELEKYPDDVGRISIACEIYEEEGRFEAALGLIEPVLVKKPNDINLVNEKARMLLKLGRKEEAKKLFEQADKAAPKNLERIETMAKLYLDLKMPDQSVEKMRDMIKLNPELKDLRFDLFRDLDHAGFQNHAVNLCKETTKPKEVVKYYNNKGVMHSKEGDRETALKEYYTALIYYPKFKENYRILFNIALAEISKKNRDGYLAAADALEKCLTLEPTFEKAKNLLKGVQEALAKTNKEAG